MKAAAAWVFLATFLLVDANPANHNHGLLKQIIAQAREILKEPLDGIYVDAVINNTRCECKDFCIAEKIISKATPPKHKLPRALEVYSKMHRCSYSETGETYQLPALINDIIHCAQWHLWHASIQCSGAAHK